MSGGLNYKQFKNLYAGIDQIKKSYNAWIHGFLLEQALKAMERARSVTPANTGRLKNAWKITKVERTGASLTVYLVNTMDYASYVEYGYTEQNGQRQAGCHMAEVSILSVTQEMPKEFEDQFKNWINNLGWK